jgi:hypothetical protein
MDTPLGTGRFLTRAGLVAAVLTLAGCGLTQGAGGAAGEGDDFSTPRQSAAAEEPNSTIWDLFRPRPDVGQVGAVNRYIWNAALETLDFLPVQTVDPFSGVITTGFGTPPGGGRAYRATILVNDPALDARSLNVALMTRSGPASPATVRAVEDAILTRARQLRAQDSRF